MHNYVIFFLLLYFTIFLMWICTDSDSSKFTNIYDLSLYHSVSTEENEYELAEWMNMSILFPPFHFPTPSLLHCKRSQECEQIPPKCLNSSKTLQFWELLPEYKIGLKFWRGFVTAFYTICHLKLCLLSLLNSCMEKAKPIYNHFIKMQMYNLLNSSIFYSTRSSCIYGIIK